MRMPQVKGLLVAVLLAVLAPHAWAVTVGGTFGVGTANIEYAEDIITQGFTATAGANFRIRSTTRVYLRLSTILKSGTGAGVVVDIGPLSPPVNEDVIAVEAQSGGCVSDALGCE